MSLSPEQTVRSRWLGTRAYTPVWKKMCAFTAERGPDTIDEIWALEHLPVFTQGRNGKSTYVYRPGDVPVVHTDRGGQVTYHGPGQLVLYTLIDLQRRQLGVRQLVEAVQNAVIGLLAHYGIAGTSRRNAPGVYINGKKIASLGLRVQRGCTYHGLSLNIAMDSTPFEWIAPCGHPGLQVCQLRDFGIDADLRVTADQLTVRLARILGYREVETVTADGSPAPAVDRRDAWLGATNPRANDNLRPPHHYG